MTCFTCCISLVRSKVRIQDLAREKLIMSEALKERVRRHLEAGLQPSLKGRRVVLKDVVLVRADGRETPVVEEARRLKPNINLSYWSGETERQKNRVFAYDREGGGTWYRGGRASRS